MKDFMMIFLGADYADLGLSPEEMQGRMGKWMAWGDKMGAAGVLRSGNALMPKIRTIASDRTVSDTTSAEVKELVGGYYIVNARDLDHVVEIAQDYPDYDLGGTVEIREVMVFDN